MFVDLEKGCDEMNPLTLSNMLCESGVDIWLLNVIRMVYDDNKI